MKRSLTLFLTLLLTFSTTWAQGTGESLDASFANPANLTDEQVQESQNFVHQGIKDRAMKEGCEKLNNCLDDEDGLPLETIIGKAYALVFGTMVKGLTKKQVDTPSTQEAKPGETKAPAQGDKTKEDQTDYCMYAAMAYETLGGLIQQGLQKKADSSAASVTDPQLQTLVSLKQTHKARKTTATWQAALYGGVATCYGVMAFTGKIALDWKYWAKLGGATALAGLYVRKAVKHKNAANEVQKVIDTLPKAGDCNPWTGTSCFCNESTSKNLYPSEYESVCVLNGGNPETPKVALGCGTVVNGKVTYDQECKCKASNTCMKASMVGMNASIGQGANLMNAANQGFDLLNKGTFDEATASSYAQGAAAMASRLRPTKPVAKPSIGLTPDQQKEADSLKPILGDFAGIAAASPMTSAPGGISNASAPSTAALDKLTPELKQKLAEGIKANYKKGNSGYAAAPSNDPGFVFPGLPGQTSAKAESTEVLSFAQQAINKADVTHAPETPIFDIISNRYRRSGWTKLEASGK